WTEKFWAPELPPPGLLTVMAAVPSSASKEAGTTAVNWLALTKVVVRFVPFHWAVEFDTKFEPFKVSVKAVLPSRAGVVLRLAKVGVGLLGGPKSAVQVCTSCTDATSLVAPVKPT